MMYYNNYGGNFSEGIREGIKNSFRKGSSLTRLIYINFKARKIPQLLEWIGVPADPEYLLSRPWTIFTYMFTQFDFLHLLFNMLWLYWFGSFFLNYFTERKLTGVYLLGGLFGGLLYIAAYNIFPYFSEPQISPFPRPIPSKKFTIPEAKSRFLLTPTIKNEQERINEILDKISRSG